MGTVMLYSVSKRKKDEAPNFFIDSYALATDKKQTVRDSMKIWVEGRLRGAIASVMVINGLVKTDKSANLRVLLPSVIQESLVNVPNLLSSNGLICELDCADFLLRGDERALATTKFYLTLRSWAIRNGFTMPEAQTSLSDISDLLGALEKSTTYHIFFLIDEVQLLALGSDGVVNDGLRLFLRTLARSAWLHGAVTGSGMLQMWWAFENTAPNGWEHVSHQLACHVGNRGVGTRP
eukprot:5903904-Amphidinium_carterae.1